MTAALRRLVPPAGPVRRVAAATLVNRAGDGLFAVGGVLFFVRGLGLPPVEVALALTAAEAVALAASLPAGAAADRFGARTVYAAVLALQAVATAAFTTVHALPAFVAVAVVAAVGGKAARAVSNALVAEVAGERRVAVRGSLRAVANVGLSVGALAGGAAVTIDTRPAYSALMLVDAATFAVAASMVLGLPAAARAGMTASGPRWPVLRDVRYLAVTALNGVISLQYWVLPIAVPLWVASRTAAPRGVLSVLLTLNTVLVVLFQTRAVRGAETVGSAAASVRRAGFVFLAGLLLLAAAGGVPSGPAVALLVAGAAVHTLGELWHAAGTFELSYGLAPPHAHGQYQGVFTLGTGAAEAVAPAVLVAACIGLGPAGWLLLGLVFAVAAAAMPPVARWAEGGGPAREAVAR
jgi:MFS family permease